MAQVSDSPIKLLAIDDEPDSLELIQDTLTQHNLEVLTTTDPEDG
jgi:response regulator RpfG family c-di-GMP phosphodiesterase